MSYTKPMIEVLNQAHNAVLTQECNSGKTGVLPDSGCSTDVHTAGAYDIDE